MNTLFQRSLATVAVAGALTLTGAAAAHADTSSPHGSDHSGQTGQSSAGASAPITLGGVSLGASSSSSSSSSSSTTTTDGERSSGESHRSQHHSSTSGGISTGPTSIDPQGMLSSRNDSQSNDSGDGSSSSGTSGGATAPIHVGGVQGDLHHASSDTDQSGSTSTDGDRSTSHRSTTGDSSSTDAAYGVGSLDVAPYGLFAQMQRYGWGNEAPGSDGSGSSLKGGLPYAFQGVSGSVDSSQDHASSDSDSRSDGDRSVTSTSSDATHQDNSLSGSGGASSGDPTLGTATQQADRGTGDDAGDTGSSGRLTGGYDAPFTSDGFTGTAGHGSATRHSSSRTTQDGDESTTQRTADQQASQILQHFGFDGLSGHPAGQFSSDDLTSSHRNR